MLASNIQESILTLIETLNPDAFVVDMGLRRGKQNVLYIFLDTDKGISLQECATINRKVGKLLEEEDPFKFPYKLEVASPGIGTPLKLTRQYTKNIGRYLRLQLEDHSSLTVKLLAVEADAIQVEPMKELSNRKKGQPKWKPLPEVHIKFNDIKESKVIII